MSISAKASLLNLSLNMSVKAVSLLPMSWHVLPWHSTFPNHPSHPRLAKLETAHNQHRTGTPLPSSTSGHRSVSRVPHDTLPLPGAHTGRNPQSGTGWDSRCASLPLFAIHLPSFPSLTVTVLGVKSYPRGVTTNSEGGIESYEAYYPVFAAMEEVGMVLNLHGEVPSAAVTNTCVLNAEPAFLPHLRKLHAQFPKLRIVLEHATTRAAVECVKSLGPTVACTITAHHLSLTVDDWAGQAWHFCKPVAKYPDDRAALQEVVKEGEYRALNRDRRPGGGALSSPGSNPGVHSITGHARFFLGSDSAPHPYESKSAAAPASACAAGVYTSPILLPLVAHLLESFGALEKLEGFVSGHGRAFYGRPAKEGGERIVLRRASRKVVAIEGYGAGTTHVVPFWAGKEIGWEIAEETSK